MADEHSSPGLYDRGGFYGVLTVSGEIMENIVIAFAKRFAEQGFYVFPLYGSRKGPMKPFGWARNTPAKEVAEDKIIPATNSTETIEQWPEMLSRGYNSSLVGYGVMGIDCVIFDLDNKDGKDGSKNFRSLMERYKIPSPTLVCKSKSGGYHLFYSKSERHANAQIKSLAGLIVSGARYDGVDVRGDGGMVIGPLFEGPEDTWQAGRYQIVKGQPTLKLTQVPDSLIETLSKTNVTSDIDALVESFDGPDEQDELSYLKRGEIPPKLSLGNRNNGFYIYLNALKNKQFTVDTARKYVQQLIAVTEESETLKDSVDIEDMITRIWSVNLNSPYDVCRDLVSLGLYRLTGHKGKLHYTILEPNPYIDSRNTHDLAAMKQLLSKFTRNMMTMSGKTKPVNPAELLDSNITPDREVSTLGYKPGAPTVFSLTDAAGGRTYLNLWNDPRSTLRKDLIDPTVWDDFRLLVSRIFGPEGSEEYQLGMDFVAWHIQKPGVKPVIAPFIMSEIRGVGKSIFFEVLQNIFGYAKNGELQAKSYKVDEVQGRFFNPSGSSIMMFDEVQFPVHRDMRKDSAAFWRHLKQLVTANTVPVELKGGDVIQMPNLSGIIMAGNTGNNFPMEEFDRRIWLVNNNPPPLLRGTVDRFFELNKNRMPKTQKLTIINSLLHYLSEHKITMQLDSIRAPMNEIKREMYLSTLSDIEEWWLTHFEDKENLLAATPIMSKSTVVYLLQTTERLMNSRWREDIEGTFRELKRRGLIRPIRTQNNTYTTRQFRGISEVRQDGSIVQSDLDSRDVLYTSRQHSEYDTQSNELVIQAYQANLQSVNKFRKARMENRKNQISNV